jgi:hypothetical protein
MLPEDVSAWGGRRGAHETALTVDCNNSAVEAYRACGFEIYQHRMVKPAS